MAMSASIGWAPRVPVMGARQDAIASGLIHRVMSPRWRSDCSYSRQFLTRYAVLYLGCREGRLWGSGMRFTVGYQG